jgi:tetratricopeptide (TPR) repeat protein
LADELTAKEIAEEDLATAEKLTLKESTAVELIAQIETAEKLTTNEISAEMLSAEILASENLTEEEPTTKGDSNPAALVSKASLPIAPSAPPVMEGDPSFGACIEHPAIVSGQLVGVAAMLGMFFWIVSQGFALAPSATSLVTTSFTFLGVSIAAFGVFLAVLLSLAFLEWVFNKLRMPKATVFCFALYDPIFRILGQSRVRGVANVDHLTIQGFANYLRSTNHFAEAAVCYSRILSTLTPLSKDRMKNERLYALSLVYDGQSARAIQYSEDLLDYWQGVTQSFTDGKAMERLAHAVYTTSIVYNLVGDKDKACSLQHALYNRLKNLNLKGDVRTIMLLSEGEALLREQRFKEAKNLLNQCCNSMGSMTPHELKMAAYEAFAVSLAYCGDKALALQQLNVAERVLSDCPTNDECLANTLMKVEVFRALNELDQAKSTIEETFEELHPAPGTFILERLKKEAELIESPELLTLMQTSDTASALTKSSELAASTQNLMEAKKEFPSTPFFETHSGVLPFMLNGVTGLLLMSIVGAVTLHNQPENIPWYCGLLFLSVAARVFVSFFKRRKGAKSKAALNDSNRVNALAKITGDTGVILTNPIDQSSMGKIFASASLLEEVKAISGDDKFAATVFEQGGKIVAIEIFGCYSSVSTSHIFP